MFACCNYKTSQYRGIWLNQNLDYLQINEDSLILTTAYNFFPHRAAYYVRDDTLVSEGDNLFCENSNQCSIKFYLHKGVIKPINTPEVSSLFFDSKDFFIRESERFSIKSFDSLTIERSELTRFGRNILSIVKINITGEIEWSKMQREKTKTYIITTNDWKNLKLELVKIDSSQFKLWNEGETADGDFLKISIFRGPKVIEFNGSMIPFYFKTLKQVTDEVELLRLQSE